MTNDMASRSSLFALPPVVDGVRTPVSNEHPLPSVNCASAYIEEAWTGVSIQAADA